MLLALAATGVANPAKSQTPDSFNPGANNLVEALVVQPDGRVVVGGRFTMMGGWARYYIARLHPSGDLDKDFNPGADFYVHALAVQKDRKIIVGGNFTSLGGQSRSRLGRLNPDGSLDTTFNPGANGEVYCLAIQPDGKIVVGGYFSALGGQPRTNIARLNPDGSLDAAFNPGADYVVNSLIVQTNGQILVGGSFSSLAGQPRYCIGRLNSNGTLDAGFDSQPNSSVYCLMIQPDNKVLVGGYFTSWAEQPRRHLARLNPDGSLDDSFNPGTDAPVHTLALQANGRILVGGAFTNLAGQACNRVGRLESNGARDPGFAADANGDVYGLTIQPDGRILVGGNFTTLGGLNRARIGRPENNEAVSDDLTFDGSTLTWSRTGACPEVCWTSYEASTNGEAWVDLGAGMRTPNGWQVSGLVVPSHATIRAHGSLPGGYVGGSSWFVEAGLGPPVIIAQPRGRTNLATTATAFLVEAVGSGPLTYQWYKDDMPLDDGSKLSGTHTPRLAVSNVFGADAGLYSAVITNSMGAVTSSVAMLSVTDPWITNQPVARSVNPGQNATFSVTALGTALSYQWRKDGNDLSSRTAASLALTNAQTTDVGYYSVVVSNSFSSVTSTIALLTVNLASADTFNPPSNPDLFAVAVQTDGRILIGGGSTVIIGAKPGRLARLKADGTLDTTFSASVGDTVFSIAVQPDGKILAAGWLTSLAGQPRVYIGRLNADGSLDTAFNPGATGGVTYPGVYALVLQADGKIVVGGDFRTLAGQSRTNLGRLYPNGTLDTNFNASAGGIVYSLALQPDGKILAGGEFTKLCGQTIQRIGRLNPDGTLDTNFVSSASDIPLALVVQPDGKIVAGGPFATLAGQARSRIGRLNPDGSLDGTFNPGANGMVRTLALQADGRILLGGEFSTLAGQSRTNLGRLNADGSLDLTFNPGANGTVYAVTVQKDGKTLVGGAFSALAGQTRNRLGRLTSTEPATDNLTFDGASITWLRGGTGPEIGRASFDTSTNGINWVNVGIGERVAGGWQLLGLDLPPEASIRARGYVTGGRYSCSTWFVESRLNVNTNSPPLILVDNERFGFITNRFGFEIEGLPLRGVIVEGSTNLKNWSPLRTNLLGNGPVYFSDPTSTNLPRCFYRARLQ